MSRREFIYWHTLATALGNSDQAERADKPMAELVDELGLPSLVLDPRASIDQVVRRDASLGELLALPREGDGVEGDDALRRCILYMKSVKNVFAQGGEETISADQYNQWLEDVRAFEKVNGYERGGLFGGTKTGGGPAGTAEDVEEAMSEIAKGQGLMSEPELRAGLQGIEKRLIDRMHLREVLADAKLAKKLTPSMALTEQLLKDKDNLKGPALRHAKALIKRFVDELGDVLAREVASASSGGIDHSRPPKRVFRNLDLKRTIWSNLTNWDPESKRLYVDRLIYRNRSKRVNKTKLIMVVDQSGSMIPAMINCAILTSIFAGLPKVDAHLVAFDTKALDLTQWVDDPFEVLLHTKLGGGNDGTCAMPFVHGKITDPANTVVVWVSDFYEVRTVMPMFAALVRAGVTFLPVGSVSSSGYFSVDPWFRRELKALGTPVISGSLKTLVKELKSSLP